MLSISIDPGILFHGLNLKNQITQMGKVFYIKGMYCAIVF